MALPLSSDLAAHQHLEQPHNGHRHVFLIVTTSPTRGSLKPPHPQMHRLDPFPNKMARGGAESRSHNPGKPPSKSSPKMALPFPLPATEDCLGVPNSLSISGPRKPGRWEISCLEWVEIDPSPRPQHPSHKYQQGALSTSPTPCCTREGADNTCPTKNSSPVICHAFRPD